MSAFCLILFASSAVLKLGDITWLFASFSLDTITHVTRLDQSRKLKYLMDCNYGNSSRPGSRIRPTVKSPDGAIVLGMKSLSVIPPTPSPRRIYIYRCITVLSFS